VCLCPRLSCGSHEHERQAGAHQPSLERLAHAVFPTNRNDPTFDRSAPGSDHFREGVDHARSVFGWQVGEHDDPDPRARQWNAPLMFGERVVAGIGRRHANSGGRGRSVAGRDWRLACQPLRQLIVKSVAKPACDWARSTAADGMVVYADDGKDFDRRPEQDHLVRGQ
jgi:hypothetical protein